MNGTDSNLVFKIGEAVKDCWIYGSGMSSADDDGVMVSAEWVDSKHKGYTVMRLTIEENGIVKFAYDDYGTECAED